MSVATPSFFMPQTPPDTPSLDHDAAPDVAALVDAVVNQLMAQGAAQHRAGNLPLAEDFYRLVLREQPRHADANHNLGVIAVQSGHAAAALSHFHAACEAQPRHWQYWISYVDALLQAGRAWDAALVLEDARQAGLAAPAIDELMARMVGEAAEEGVPAPAAAGPDANDVVALTALVNGKDFAALRDRALPLCERFPDNPLPWRMLVLARDSLGEAQDVLPARLRLAELCPEDVDNLNTLGLALTTQGRLVDAEYAFRRILLRQPAHVSGLSNLGLVLQRRQRLQDAEVVLRQCIAVAPDFPIAHLNLSVVLDEMGRAAAAEVAVRRALALRPDFIQAHNSLGFLLKDQGRVAEALASTQRALALAPQDPHVHSNLLFLLNYDADRSAEEIFAAYRHYDEVMAQPLRRFWQPHANSRQWPRRLRVGYVSPSFTQHSTRHFLEPLLQHHDHARIEVVAYCESAQAPDATTLRYQDYFDHWVSTTGLSDEALAQRIRDDGIDVLVDIAGHTRGNRLGMFAHKPAPVSLHWLDYGYTTGVSAIDYYLTDQDCAPPGSEHLFAEAPWRLPGPAQVFRPGTEMGEEGPLPALRNGFVTFATLTRAIRINHHCIRVWSKILQRVPDAQLVIDSGNFQDPVAQAAMAARFAEHGIAPERLRIGCHSPPWELMRGIDIGLDCFPHNSGTTLFEMLHQGVPYVTLRGRPSVGRLGGAILRAVGHLEWATDTEDAYVDAAVALASDLPALAQVRASLRQAMLEGPLRDEAGFARHVEDAYGQMFARWAASA